MNLEGRLTIDLTRLPDGSGDARIASSRPLHVTRAFAGKPIQDAVRTLPLLFNVCGLAQGTAAVEAAERALGMEVSPATRRARGLLVLAETAREHQVCAVSDWPNVLGEAPDRSILLGVLRTFESLRTAVDPGRSILAIEARSALDADRTLTAVASLISTVEDTVLGEPIGHFETRTTKADLEDWYRPGATPAQRLVRLVATRGWSCEGDTETRFLPCRSGKDLAPKMLNGASRAFIAAPTWGGSPHETTTFSRQAASPLVTSLRSACGSGLLTRIAARLVELSALPARMKAMVTEDASQGSGHSETTLGSSAPWPQCGIAEVEAARGRLVHGVEVCSEHVSRYAILAPTEWNFHPEGAARRGLAQIAGEEEDLRPRAQLFIAAMDPCVGYELRVH
jgi:hypothetical protein